MARPPKIIFGGKNSFFWWRNACKHRVDIRDSCTTEVNAYQEILNENCLGCWQMYVDDWNDKVWLVFANPKDAAYFKLLWS